MRWNSRVRDAHQEGIAPCASPAHKYTQTAKPTRTEWIDCEEAFGDVSIASQPAKSIDTDHSPSTAPLIPHLTSDLSRSTRCLHRPTTRTMDLQSIHDGSLSREDPVYVIHAAPDAF